MLHRDIKPANIVRDADGRFVLTDFGLGLARRDAAAATMAVAGSPMYMAPELLFGATPMRVRISTRWAYCWCGIRFPAASVPRRLAPDPTRCRGQWTRPSLAECRSGLPAALLSGGVGHGAGGVTTPRTGDGIRQGTACRSRNRSASVPVAVPPGASWSWALRRSSPWRPSSWLPGATARRVR
ncbi:MAG: hypothetical protein IPH86_19490 [bacterium]|nr:hypothetical protein [bacterium]